MLPCGEQVSQVDSSGTAVIRIRTMLQQLSRTVQPPSSRPMLPRAVIPPLRALLPDHKRSKSWRKKVRQRRMVTPVQCATQAVLLHPAQPPPPEPR